MTKRGTPSLVGQMAKAEDKGAKRRKDAGEASAGTKPKLADTKVFKLLATPPAVGDDDPPEHDVGKDDKPKVGKSGKVKGTGKGGKRGTAKVSKEPQREGQTMGSTRAGQQQLPAASAASAASSTAKEAVAETQAGDKKQNPPVVEQQPPLADQHAAEQADEELMSPHSGKTQSSFVSDGGETPQFDPLGSSRAPQVFLQQQHTLDSTILLQFGSADFKKASVVQEFENLCGEHFWRRTKVKGTRPKATLRTRGRNWTIWKRICRMASTAEVPWASSSAEPRLGR